MDEKPPEEEIVELTSRPLTAREKYYYDQSCQEPVAGAARIEDTAKFLAGAAATTSGLYVAAAKLARGTEKLDPAAAKGLVLLWLTPFLFWSAALICLVMVLLPRKYPADHNTPDSWEQAFRQARETKYHWLLAGAILFVIGILAAALPLALS